jgi:hypothetical protein
MTDPKAKPVDPKPEKADKPDDKKVFIRNNGKTPFVIPDAGVTLKPKRVTPVPAAAWEAFKQTPFGKSILDEDLVEEVDEEEHTAQPKTEAEQLDENEAAEDAAAQGRNRKPRK